jgi:hypothetical protein
MTGIWTQNMRELCFITFYILEYYSHYSLDIVINNDFLERVKEVYYSLKIDPEQAEDIDINQLNNLIAKYLLLKDTWADLLKKYSKSWDKTPLTVKALFYVFCLENNINQSDLSEVKDGGQVTEELNINKYLRICEKYYDKSNVPTLHAILLQIRDFLFPHLMNKPENKTEEEAQKVEEKVEEKLEQRVEEQIEEKVEENA